MTVSSVVLEHHNGTDGDLITSNRQSGTTVRCAFQAFGTGLGGKGIRLEVVRPGFFCGSDTQDKLVKSANFLGGEAEILISLPADDWKLCFQSMNVWVTLPYSCSTINRLVTKAEWGWLSSPLGTCRALQQKCGQTTSNAAIPYIDMWCRRPANYLNGRAEEMQLEWAFGNSADNC